MQVTGLICFLSWAIIGLMACKSAKPASGSQDSDMLYGNRWELIEMHGDRVEKSDRMDPHLFFQDNGEVSGSPGCNHLAGSYMLSDDDRIKFSALIITKMACPEPTIEYLFMQALETTQSWRLENGILLFFANGKVIARFRSASRDS